MSHTFTFNNDQAYQHLLDLIAVPGLSGCEDRVANVVMEKLISCGCRPEWIFFDDAHHKISSEFNVGNLIVKLPGNVAGARKLFVSHLDTVPICKGAVPIREKGRVINQVGTGLGGDDRTGVACLVTLIESILTNKLPHPPLTFLFTIAEEIGLLGARTVDIGDLGHPEFAFNIDSGVPEHFITSAIGADRWEVEIHGKSAHAGVHPEDGVSALLIAAIAITDVEKQGYFGKVTKKHGRGSSNVGIINGGDATNQVNDYIYVKGESRSANPLFIDEITMTYKNAFNVAAGGVKNNRGTHGSITFSSWRDYDPFKINKRSKLALFSHDIARHIGFKPKFIHVEGGLDANALNAKNIPTITLGAGQHNAHTINEYVDINEYYKGCLLAGYLAVN